MHERTFLAAMVGIDLLLILGGGALTWSHAAPMATLLTAAIGAAMLFQLNLFVFGLAESAQASRAALGMAALFIVVSVIGGIAGMLLR
jgi:hypothetical protein